MRRPHLQQPQEVEVWYILPAIRRELAKFFVGKAEKTQKEAADILNVTEAAISQYLAGKRAQEVDFEDEIIDQIRNSGKRILNDGDLLVREIQKLCDVIREKYVLCEVHRKFGKAMEECTACLK